MPASPPPSPALALSSSPASTGERAKVAVLPIDDERLFRAERAELRQILAGQLARLATDHAILPTAEVDATLRPVSAATGARCAFEGAPVERRASARGWLTTEVLHVFGTEGKPEELWVQVLGAHHLDAVTWTAPWDARFDVLDRYRASFAALARQQDGGGLIGGLAASGSGQGALREGPVTVCETKRFGACDAVSAAWKDRAGELAACFGGEDEVAITALVQGDRAPARCEIAGLDAAAGREGEREACLCRALTASSGLRAGAGRRTVRVRFEAADLAGRLRPGLSVIEASGNLHGEADWRSIRSEREGKTAYRSSQRLVVDHLDALAAPLARCAVPAGSTVVADVDVCEDGAAGGARLVAGPAGKDAAACVQRTLGRGAFNCTSDGKAAKVRIAIAWPEATK